MIFLNNLPVIKTVFDFGTRPTEHLSIRNTMLTIHSNRHDMVKANIFLKSIYRYSIELAFAHSASVIARLCNSLLIGVVKNKMVIGTHNSLARIVPVLVAIKETAIGVSAFHGETITTVATKLSWVSSLVGKTITTLFASPAFRIDSYSRYTSTRFIAVPFSKTTQRRFLNAKMLAYLSVGKVFNVIKFFKLALSNFSRFSGFHSLIVAQPTAKNKVDGRYNYANKSKILKGAI